ncbi:hypothetical protein BKA67DRAFT_132060 [Truncatella angustata]|uniref:Uncharacterized protein n=1 Tax=Truncatella angustata TaxID=152316 RepID=A0A9P8RES8_9PEZI|nr:uncharacterized protein BKA67DRAFT_132060 [Truncatella angustata]KAH6643277.1 hypothetical protein BKA67DRAFT_132060 [Truncatella angustata]
MHTLMLLAPNRIPLLCIARIAIVSVTMTNVLINVLCRADPCAKGLWPCTDQIVARLSTLGPNIVAYSRLRVPASLPWTWRKWCHGPPADIL